MRRYNLYIPDLFVRLDFYWSSPKALPFSSQWASVQREVTALTTDSYLYLNWPFSVRYGTNTVPYLGMVVCKRERPGLYLMET